MSPARLPVASRTCAALVGLLALSALTLQYILLVQLTRDTIGVGLGTLRFITYFTILSNIAVALVAFTAASARPGFFAQARVRGAVALYIGVTGSIYFFILRHLWQPQGAQWWADTALHYAVPLLYLSWWGLCAPHGVLRWHALPRWLLFPLAYLGWVLLRGAWVHEYPYPFLDLAVLDGATVARNIVGVFAVFVVAGGMLLLADRLLAPRRRVVSGRSRGSDTR